MPIVTVGLAWASNRPSPRKRTGISRTAIGHRPTAALSLPPSLSADDALIPYFGQSAVYVPQNSSRFRPIRLKFWPCFSVSKKKNFSY
jgi:hypothetical protein